MAEERGGYRRREPAHLYVTPILTTSDGATYKCIVTQPGYESTSTANIQLTVVQDVTPPTVVKVIGSPFLDTVIVSFSEPIEPNSAQTASNYGLSGGLTISGATVDVTGTTVANLTGSAAFQNNATRQPQNANMNAGAPITGGCAFKVKYGLSKV